MRILRRSFVVAIALLSVTAASASASYVFKSGAGNAVPGGRYGENLQFVQKPGTSIDLTVPTSPTTTATNHCQKARLAAQVFTNDPALQLLGKVRSGLFSQCDLAQIYFTGTPAIGINQGQSTVYKVGAANGIAVLARNLGGTPGLNCEYRGNLTIAVYNPGDAGAGQPTTIKLGHNGNVATGNKLNLYTLSAHGDSFTTSDAGCPPFGRVSGTLVLDGASTDDGISIG